MTLTNLRSVRSVTLIEAVVAEGAGTREDPARLVTYYFTPAGRPVTTDDSCGIEHPEGIGTDGMFPDERHPRPKHPFYAQPDGSLRSDHP